ncbi:RidA family protein [Nocardia sp. NPDC059239]|uniref:RidA family protein n=1 Tax=Nocardia sp. NPDC059239 TaxID=3346785 RepID=UPI0036A55CFE
MTSFLHEVIPDHFPWYDYTRYSYSLGVARDGHAWLSGNTASEFDPETKHMVVRGSMGDQAKTAYAKIRTLLEAEGLDPSQVTHIVENVTAEALPLYPEVAAVRQELFGEHNPVVNTVVVQRLLRHGAFIEVEITVDSAHSTSEGGIVYLPTLLPLDPPGHAVTSGDLEQQAESVYKQAFEMLKALGLGVDSIAKTIEFSTPATLDDYTGIDTVRAAALGPVYPASTGIVMPRLAHEDALIAVNITASRDAVVAVTPHSWHHDDSPRSAAIRTGCHLYISGQTAIDPETGHLVGPDDVAEQAEYIYSNLLDLLQTAGCGPEHLVRTVEYVTPEGLAGYRAVAGVREGLLYRPYPASTGLVCDSLRQRGALIEVDPTARLP